MKRITILTLAASVSLFAFALPAQARPTEHNNIPNWSQGSDRPPPSPTPGNGTGVRMEPRPPRPVLPPTHTNGWGNSRVHGPGRVG